MSFYSQQCVSDLPSVRVLARPEETFHKHTYLSSLTRTDMPCAVKTVFKPVCISCCDFQSNSDFRKEKNPTKPPTDPAPTN